MYFAILDFFSSNYIPTDPKEFASRIFVTCYMGTENSSEETRKRASNLAEEIGSHHMGKEAMSTEIVFRCFYQERKRLISYSPDLNNEFDRGSECVTVEISWK